MGFLAFLLISQAAPRVDLYTMGPGDELFSAFGHAAICVEARCYNYGTADFQTPVPLTWNFVRGRARFWVSVLPREAMLGYYASVDRSVWRQRLSLPESEARALAELLEASTDESVKYYRYHHFDDNCTTRIRDLVDRATGGTLRRDPGARSLSFREWARQGFAGNWPLLAATELLLGRSADRRTDSWSAMFLPSELRAEVEQRLHSPPELVYARKRPLPDGSQWLGALAFITLGALLALVVLAGRARRWTLAPAAFVLGLIALVLDALALLSTFPELTRNEMLLVFWPTDFALPWLPRGYVKLRLGALALIVLLHAGLLTQPLAPLATVALPLSVYLLVGWRRANRDRGVVDGRTSVGG
jgi:hypothetical protein